MVLQFIIPNVSTKFSSSVTEGVKYSSSSLDALTCLFEMKSFWDKLHWPPSEGAADLCITLTQVRSKLNWMCVCVCPFNYLLVFIPLFNHKSITKEAISYVDKLCSIWPQYNRCTNATQFNVTQQLCIIISNIHHIQEELKPAPLSNSSEKKLFTLENDPCIVQSTSDLLQQTKGTIQSLFQEASDSCRQKILTLCEQMGHQVD